MLKKKYSIDLAGDMAECEANYARIMRLLPDMDTVDQRVFDVDLPDNHTASFQVTVKERCKYTTMIDISQLAHTSQPVHGLSPRIFFSLRVYHDARMAEVMTFNRHQRLQARYSYPNANMYHSDEKAQLNTFLGEWLSHCLFYGRALENPAVAMVINK